MIKYSIHFSSPEHIKECSSCKSTKIRIPFELIDNNGNSFCLICAREISYPLWIAWNSYMLQVVPRISEVSLDKLVTHRIIAGVDADLPVENEWNRLYDQILPIIIQNQIYFAYWMPNYSENVVKGNGDHTKFSDLLLQIDNFSKDNPWIHYFCMVENANKYYGNYFQISEDNLDTKKRKDQEQIIGYIALRQEGNALIPALVDEAIMICSDEVLLNFYLSEYGDVENIGEYSFHQISFFELMQNMSKGLPIAIEPKAYSHFYSIAFDYSADPSDLPVPAMIQDEKYIVIKIDNFRI